MHAEERRLTSDALISVSFLLILFCYTRELINAHRSWIVGRFSYLFFFLDKLFVPISFEKEILRRRDVAAVAEARPFAPRRPSSTRAQPFALSRSGPFSSRHRAFTGIVRRW